MNDFTVSTYSVILCPEGRFGVSFWCLLVTLGSLFQIFEGPRDRLENCWFLMDSRGPQELRQDDKWKVKMAFQGVSNFTPYNHPGCKIEASRLQDLKSEVEGLKVERISNLRLKG